MRARIGAVMAFALTSTMTGALLAAEFFVAPIGTPGGEGSQSSPWDLQTALDHPSAVQPGDTI